MLKLLFQSWRYANLKGFKFDQNNPKQNYQLNIRQLKNIFTAGSNKLQINF